MEPEIIGAYIGAGASLLVGGGGIVAACVANSRAKAANQNAQKANKIASDALTKAAEANQIAKDANTLSEEANTISRNNVAKQFDPSHVEWVVKWDPEAAVIELTHTGRDAANNISVLVQGGEIDELVKRDRPAVRGDRIEIPLPQIIDDRRDYNAKAVARHSALINSGWIRSIDTFELDMFIDVRWDSDLGNPGSELHQLTVS